VSQHQSCLILNTIEAIFIFPVRAYIFDNIEVSCLKRKNKSRNLNTYSKPKLIKQEVTFPIQDIKIDWCDIVT